MHAGQGQPPYRLEGVVLDDAPEPEPEDAPDLPPDPPPEELPEPADDTSGDADTDPAADPLVDTDDEDGGTGTSSCGCRIVS